MAIITIDTTRIDWLKLREQKLWLINVANALPLCSPESNAADGILQLIDWLQDKAVDEAGVPEADVFMQPTDDEKECEHDYVLSRGCGVKVCTKCDDHKGLVRCYCGWSKTSPGQGYQELLDLGETIEEDY